MIMDQQQLSAMDPKLREAYTRIMGLAVQPKSAPPVAPMQNPLPAQQTATQVENQPVNHPLNESPSPMAQMASPDNPPNNIQTQTTPSQQENPATSTPLPVTPPRMTQAPTPTPPSAPQMPSTEIDHELANNQIHAYVSEEVAGAKRSIQMIQMVYLIGGLAFLVFYVLFWMRVFAIPSPF